MIRLFTSQRSRKRGQGMVEFAIALPILLLLMMGIIEFARILQAWLAVQNAARYGLRFLVTGEYDPAYCEEATAALGLSSADTYGGDPANDCYVPDDYGNDARDLTNALVDWARLPSAVDVARVGATGIGIDDSVTGDYLAFLLNHSSTDLGIAALPRYFHVTICSNRDGDLDGFGDFQWNGEDSAAYQSLNVVTCYDSIDAYLMDDAGGPGDRVRVYVTYKHATIVPYLSQWWPIVPLVSWREGIVERFRTSRISGIGSEIINVPTDTPTATNTGTATPSPTASETPTATNTPTATATPDCTPYSIGQFSISGQYIYIDLINNAGSPVNVDSVIIDWDYAEDLGEMMGATSRNLYLDWIRFGGTTRWGSGANDYGSPTNTMVDSPSTWSSPTLAAGSTTVSQSSFGNRWTGFGTDGRLLGTDFGMIAYLDNGCILERPAIERPLPEINCDLYTISGPTLLDNGIVQFMLRNNDSYGANVSSIQANWDYLEDFFELVQNPSDTSVRADWIAYDTYAGGYKVWGSANGGGNDYESPTDTLVDVPSSTMLPRPFDINLDYYMQIEFDKNNESPANWLTYYGMLPSDFGVLVNFDNGCVLEIPAEPRSLATPTPNCDLIYSQGASLSGEVFQIRVRNDNFAPAYLTYSELVWPTTWNPNMYFNYFRFNYNKYWDPDPIYTSPVATNAPNIALNGRSSAYWQSDFNNWPSVPAGGGLFSGYLLFDYEGLVCPVFDQLEIFPTSTSTSTSTSTNTPDYSPTWTGTATNTGTPTNTSTNTLIPTNTNTPTNTSTITNTPLHTNTFTSTSTNTPTNTGTPATATLTPTVCLTPPDLGGCH